MTAVPPLILADVVDPRTKLVTGRLPVYGFEDVAMQRVPLVALVRMTDNNVQVGEVFGETPFNASRLLARKPAVCKLTPEAAALMPLVETTEEDPTPRAFTIADARAAGLPEDVAIVLGAQEEARRQGLNPIEAMKAGIAALEKHHEERGRQQRAPIDPEMDVPTQPETPSAKAKADAAEVASVPSADDAKKGKASPRSGSVGGR